MRFPPRRRAFAALLLAALLGWPFVGLDGHLALELAYQSRASGYRCAGGTWRILDSFNSCGSNNPWPVVVELVLVTALGLSIAYGLARWVVSPIASMAATVHRFGPTSLGLRMRLTGPRDETRRLGDEIDAMLDRLAEGYDAQRRFAANASHELRTPLATQRALIEISLTSAPTAEQLDLLARQLLATNERNERLVDGLLVLAETERGLMSRAAVDLGALVEDVVATLRDSAGAAAVTLESSVVPVRVPGEAPLLERLVVNLVQNAIKYNDPGGSVRVAVTADGTLTVGNSGPQVPAEAVGALFEPFRRLSGDRLDHGGGVGLGLTIARSIVAAHGGAIDARANPDGGLTVRVSLPTS